jgi:hypothetical protein
MSNLHKFLLKHKIRLKINFRQRRLQKLTKNCFLFKILHIRDQPTFLFKFLIHLTSSENTKLITFREFQLQSLSNPAKIHFKQKTAIIAFERFLSICFCGPPRLDCFMGFLLSLLLEAGLFG